MTSNQARSAFAMILVVGIAAAAFRVATAPDRIKERKDTARTVCLNSGGEWVVVDRNEICRKPGDSGQGG
jgi:hypothetical protein